MTSSLYLLANRIMAVSYHFQIFPGQVDNAIDFFRQIGWYTDIEYARGSRGEHFFATSHPLKPGIRFVEINTDTIFQEDPELNLVLLVNDFNRHEIVEAVSGWTKPKNLAVAVEHFLDITLISIPQVFNFKIEFRQSQID